MARWVTPVMTGRQTLPLNFPAGNGLSAVQGELQVSSDNEWTRSRLYVCVEVLRRVHNLSEEQAVRAASVAVVLWANESGWGNHEWNWDAFGIHCNQSESSSDSCVDFRSNTNSQIIKAYENLWDGIVDFWRVAINLVPDALTEFSAGTLSAVRTLQRSGYTGGSGTPARDLLSIYQRVYSFVTDRAKQYMIAPSRQFVAAGEPDGGSLGRSGGGGGAGTAVLVILLLVVLGSSSRGKQ